MNVWEAFGWKTGLHPVERQRRNRGEPKWRRRDGGVEEGRLLTKPQNIQFAIGSHVIDATGQFQLSGSESVWRQLGAGSYYLTLILLREQPEIFMCKYICAYNNDRKLSSCEHSQVILWV